VEDVVIRKTEIKRLDDWEQRENKKTHNGRGDKQHPCNKSTPSNFACPKLFHVYTVRSHTLDLLVILLDTFLEDPQKKGYTLGCTPPMYTPFSEIFRLRKLYQVFGQKSRPKTWVGTLI
jgi:hypothetical protein